VNTQQIAASPVHCPAKISAELDRNPGPQSLPKLQNRQAAAQMMASPWPLLLNCRIDHPILKTISTPFISMVRSWISFFNPGNSISPSSPAGSIVNSKK
jgi:hypothetical protein